MQEVIKDFREFKSDYNIEIGDNYSNQDSQKLIEQFLLTKLKEERIKTLDEVERQTLNILPKTNNSKELNPMRIAMDNMITTVISKVIIIVTTLKNQVEK